MDLVVGLILCKDVRNRGTKDKCSLSLPLVRSTLSTHKEFGILNNHPGSLGGGIFAKCVCVFLFLALT